MWAVVSREIGHHFSIYRPYILLYLVFRFRLNYKNCNTNIWKLSDYLLSLQRFRITGNWRQTRERKTKG